MKILLLIPFAGLLVWAGMAFHQSDPSDPSDPTDPVRLSCPLPPPAATSTDTAAVFQRAFWRRAAADDKILHVERREWSGDTKEVTHWQWFITFEPGAALKTWLKESNPFTLRPVTETVHFQTFAAAPDWFPRKADPDTYEIQQAAGGRMTLAFSRNQNILYATAAGQGFQKSVQ